MRSHRLKAPDSHDSAKDLDFNPDLRIENKNAVQPSAGTKVNAQKLDGLDIAAVRILD